MQGKTKGKTFEDAVAGAEQAGVGLKATKSSLFAPGKKQGARAGRTPRGLSRSASSARMMSSVDMDSPGSSEGVGQLSAKVDKMAAQQEQIVATLARLEAAIAKDD